ncbi:MAG: hypothetical protein K9L68_05010 [Spirochaetales bacterium]|nr:hypothetical protein [Spirochaetales bacterium]MCF7937938.1 hypothetical protein [Spirochaetales bacterium]
MIQKTMQNKLTRNILRENLEETIRKKIVIDTLKQSALKPLNTRVEPILHD